MDTPVVDPNQFLKQLLTWARSGCSKKWTPNMCKTCALNDECNGLIEVAARLEHTQHNIEE